MFLCSAVIVSILGHLTYIAGLPGSQLAAIKNEISTLAVFSFLNVWCGYIYTRCKYAGRLPMCVADLAEDCPYIILAATIWPNEDIDMLIQTRDADPETLHLEIKKEHHVWFGTEGYSSSSPDNLVVKNNIFQLGSYGERRKLVFELANVHDGAST